MSQEGEGEWWSLTPDELAQKLDTDLERGLTDAQVLQARQKHGWNRLREPPKVPGYAAHLCMVVRRHCSREKSFYLLVMMVYIIVAVCLTLQQSGFDGGLWSFAEPLVILVCLTPPLLYEASDEQLFAEMKGTFDPAEQTVSVTRNGSPNTRVPVSELVPGDLVRLAEGAAGEGKEDIPADMSVVRVVNPPFECQEAALTGECHLMEKKAEGTDRWSRGVFKGTEIRGGAADAIVTATGKQTMFGGLYTVYDDDDGEFVSDDEGEFGTVPVLDKKLAAFQRRLLTGVVVLSILGWVTHSRFVSWEQCTYYLKLTLALTYLGTSGLRRVQEGVEHCRALSMDRLAEHNVLVKEPKAVETLGCATVLCVDKTGVLTTTTTYVTEVVAMGKLHGELRQVPVGGCSDDPNDGGAVDVEREANVNRIVEVCSVVSSCDLVVKDGVYSRSGGDMTTGAMRVFAEKMGGRSTLSDPEPERAAVAQRLRTQATLSFDSRRKMMSAVVSPASGPNLLLSFGGSDRVLSKCTKVQLQGGEEVPLDDTMKARINAAAETAGRLGKRIIGLAYKSLEGTVLGDYTGQEGKAHELISECEGWGDIETELVFCGMLWMQNPPRRGVRDTMIACRDAGVRLIMLTGDHPSTAESVAQDVGIIGKEEVVPMSGMQWEDMEEDSKEAYLRGVGGRVFARVSPVQKLCVVSMLNMNGESTVMIGDGVNDAPAVKAAGVGVALGINGEEITKEASQVVLLDDDITSVVAAIKEGRSIVQRATALTSYVITYNVGILGSYILAAALSIPIVLNPVPLLWLTLPTPRPPVWALAQTRPGPLSEEPSRAESISSAWMLFRCVTIGLYVGFAAVGVFVVWYTRHTFMGLDLSSDGHTVVSLEQLRGWAECDSGSFAGGSFTAGGEVLSYHGCDYFGAGKAKAWTLAFSVLVVTEVLTGFNYARENASLAALNWVLVLQQVLILVLHCLILYLPTAAGVFGVVPLGGAEWVVVLALGLPVVLLDEVIKCAARATGGGGGRSLRGVADAGEHEGDKISEMV
eukprot:Hpha_TRINITY_DN10530_c0_g1::TRINITY_DN10530_c0_g1_i1::g.31586::m.31586/K01537/E3.6.3.8; Ca2+-transporting ATPase